MSIYRLTHIDQSYLGRYRDFELLNVLETNQPRRPNGEVALYTT